MEIKYRQDAHTLYIEFRPAELAETRDLDEHSVLDLDKERTIPAITVEHASDRADIPHFSFEHLPPNNRLQSD